MFLLRQKPEQVRKLVAGPVFISAMSALSYAMRSLKKKSGMIMNLVDLLSLRKFMKCSIICYRQKMPKGSFRGCLQSLQAG